jgi:transposase
MSIEKKQEHLRRYYDPVFKKDAVERVIRTGKSCAEVSRELGLPGNMLSRWKREYLASADRNISDVSPLKPSEMAEQLHQARLEAEDLRQQRDILKKALSIFSQPSSNGGR